MTPELHQHGQPHGSRQSHGEKRHFRERTKKVRVPKKMNVGSGQHLRETEEKQKEILFLSKAQRWQAGLMEPHDSY